MIPSRQKHNGFTLVELLVVIAIIALLAAILFPVFAKARENARRSSCASNLKQLALGILMYAQDNDSRLPSYTRNGNVTWGKFYIPTAPYVKNDQLYHCPNVKKPDVGITDIAGVHYAMPYQNETSSFWVAQLAGPIARGTSSLDAVPEAARTCLIGETRETGGPISGKDRYWDLGRGWSQFRILSTTWDYAMPSRHLGGSNYAYVDGHVKWLKMETVDWARRNGAASANRTNSQQLPIIFNWSSG